MTAPRASRLRVAAATLVIGVTATACGAATTGAVETPHSTPLARTSGTAANPVVYAAIGASETVGVGARDRLRQAWPQLLFNAALPESAVLYNFGIPGATVADALNEELPAALAVHPTLVTIWLNVNDLIAGVPPATYEAQLTQLVGAVARAGVRRILIATTPSLDRLPAYLACGRPVTALHCPILEPVPTAGQVNALVDGYNAAIARVARLDGAVVVDLQAQGEVADLHPNWVSTDGLHPNALGYRAVALAFQAALSATAP